MLLVAVAGCGQTENGASGEPGRKPNIVLLVIDTARADHFSCYGYGKRTTPNVDALAARGVLFRHARSVAPWTLPAHMSMFTGLPPRDHGATWAAFSEPETAALRELVGRSFTPREPERMLAARLRAEGYRTYGFSPNPWIARNKGFAEGFDAFFELWRAEEREAALGRPAANDFEQSASGAAVGGAKRMLAEHPRAAPFFLFVNFLDPHFPYEPPAPFRERFGGTEETVQALQLRGTKNELGMIAGVSPFSSADLVPLYDAELAAADDALGELVRWLESTGLFDDTLVVLTSDHGELLGERGRFSHQLYVDEPLMHVPLILKLPGGGRAGTVVDTPLVSNLDVYATVLAAAGAKNSAPGGLSRDLTSESPTARSLLVGEYAPSRAYLRQLQAVNAAFDLEAHLRARFVVYTSEFRTELAGLQALETSPLLGALANSADEARLAEASRAAELALEAYLADKDETRSVDVGGASADAETNSQLEALGYVGGEDPEPPAPRPPTNERRGRE